MASGTAPGSAKGSVRRTSSARGDVTEFGGRRLDAVPNPPPDRSVWTFLTNHAHVLICIAEDPTVRLRDVAARVGITERAAQSIVADLVAAEYLVRERVGRRNQYELNGDLPLRHPIEQHHTVGELLELLRHRPAAPRSMAGSTGGRGRRTSQD